VFAVSMIPDASVFLIVAVVLALAFILDRLVFRPVLGIIKQREDAVVSARKLAERAALEAREAAQALSDARAQLDRDVAAARARLDADADALAADAANRILGRQPS
jgi:F0F1-type ATP synthase membrane subunit b/b'